MGLDPLPKYDRQVCIKVTAGQLRHLKAVARQRGEKFGVWARDALLKAAPANGHGRRIEAPRLMEE